MKQKNKTTELHKIALGGGCHWCTEAVFQVLQGVEQVEQGYVASIDENSTFSEAIIIHFTPKQIPLRVLIAIHLHTHKSTSKHSMRKKYRSAIYTFSAEQEEECTAILNDLQSDFSEPLITSIYPFSAFRASREEIQDYYKKNPNKPFCERFIHPKLTLLLRKYNSYIDEDTQKEIQTSVDQSKETKSPESLLE